MTGLDLNVSVNSIGTGRKNDILLNVNAHMYGFTQLMLTHSILTAEQFFVVVWKFEALFSTFKAWAQDWYKIQILIYKKNHQSNT